MVGSDLSKSEILKELLGKKHINGSDLAFRLGITRAAVWKSIRSLREEGFVISSKPNGGYSLGEVPDILLPELIRAHLEDRSWNITVHERIDSTNSEAKRLSETGLPDKSAILAAEQTGGRGRLGRSFVSKKGLGLYLTAVFKPEGSPESISVATALTAVAVRRAIARTTGLSPQIKWTNDLVLNGKKLCGILTELSVEGESGNIQYMATGIGINTAYEPEDFSREIRDFCTSLSMEGKKVARAALAAAVLDELSRIYSNGRFTADLKEYHSEYERSCVTIGREVSVIRGTEKRRGKAVGLDDSFGLIVDFGDGLPVTVTSGEVSVRGLYGYV
jgi:BirA family biotin operon repressor/biotin-[acetyl-CoA-carboxylase] ligase